MKARGKVKWFDDNKHIGIITTDDGEDAFVILQTAQNNGLRTLHVGEAVEFELTRDPRGVHATDVIVL